MCPLLEFVGTGAVTSGGAMSSQKEDSRNQDRAFEKYFYLAAATQVMYGFTTYFGAMYGWSFAVAATRPFVAIMAEIIPSIERVADWHATRSARNSYAVVQNILTFAWLIGLICAAVIFALYYGKLKAHFENRFCDDAGHLREDARASIAKITTLCGLLLLGCSVVPVFGVIGPSWARGMPFPVYFVLYSLGVLVLIPFPLVAWSCGMLLLRKSQITI